MVKIANEGQFRGALAQQSLSSQRKLAALFIEQVLDLTEDQRVRMAVNVAKSDNPTAEDLNRAYHSAHSCYVETHPRSDLAELDFKRQAAHFVTEACLVALSPIYEGTQEVRLAQKAATYCRMARTCASMQHDQEEVDFTGLADPVNAQIRAQYQVAEGFLAT